MGEYGRHCSDDINQKLRLQIAACDLYRIISWILWSDRLKLDHHSGHPEDVEGPEQIIPLHQDLWIN